MLNKFITAAAIVGGSMGVTGVANAQVFNFADFTFAPISGSEGCPLGNVYFRCQESAAGMVYSSGGVLATVTAGSLTANQDPGEGLGVFSVPTGMGETITDWSDDNIDQVGETLRVAFSTSIGIDSLFINSSSLAGGHATPDSGVSFLMSINDGGFGTFVTGLGGLVSSIVGPVTSLSFRLGTDDRAQQFYVGAVNAVPEPETYALMLAGLAGVGFMARRRRVVQ